MSKKEVVLLIALTLLSIIVTASVYFGLNSDDLQNMLNLKLKKWQQPSRAGNLTTENITGQTEPEQNQTLEEANQTLANQTEPEEIDSTLWCNPGDKIWVTSDIFGEGREEKSTIGVEVITLGEELTDNSFICEACRTTVTFSETDRTVDEWTNAPKIILLGGDIGKEECTRYVSSKTYLWSNQSEVGNETINNLIFSNATLTKESWYDSEGRRCMVTNNLLRAIRGAEC